MLAEKGSMPQSKEDECYRAVTNSAVGGFALFDSRALRGSGMHSVFRLFDRERLGYMFLGELFTLNNVSLLLRSFFLVYCQ